MAEKNANLLLSDAAPPAAGIQYASAKAWYGGDIAIVATGEFTTLNAQIVFCVRLPKLNVGQTYADVLTDEDWVPLHTFTEPGVFRGPLNPCLLAVRAATPGAANVRILIS